MVNNQSKEPGIRQVPFSHNRSLLKLVTLCVLGLIGCSANSNTTINATKVEKQANLDHSPMMADMKVGETIAELTSGVKVEHGGLILDLLQVNDSRCPIGETCIWAGQIEVLLRVSGVQLEPTDIKLVRKREANTVFAAGHGFRLLDVKPHPQKDVTIQTSEQTAQIGIVAKMEE